MDDLISRKALIEKINDTNIKIMFDLPVEELLGEDVDMDNFCTLLQDAIQAYRKLIIGDVIKKVPSVEAVPVVRGEWILKSHLGEWECSNCKSMMVLSDDINGHPSFCPNCGADMRKKVQE